MYDINLKNVKKGKNFYFIFLAAGLLFLAIISVILFFNFKQRNELDSQITSSHVDVRQHISDEGSTMYTPVYYYEVNGKEYACGSNASSSFNPGTGNKTVYYDSKNPEKCMSEFSNSINGWLLLFLLLPIIFIAIAVVNIKKVNQRVKLINQLNLTGKLVKNLPYRLEDSGIVVNGRPIQKPVIDYRLSSGSTITLYGDPRHDGRSFDNDGMVDLVIDENNPENYFIDFEINRISGNLASDYYANKQQTTGQNPSY